MGDRASVQQLAERHVWTYHGRGLSTSVGVHTRRLLAQAFVAGYRAARRERERPREDEEEDDHG